MKTILNHLFVYLISVSAGYGKVIIAGECKPFHKDSMRSLEIQYQGYKYSLLVRADGTFEFPPLEGIKKATEITIIFNHNEKRKTTVTPGSVQSLHIWLDQPSLSRVTRIQNRKINHMLNSSWLAKKPPLKIVIGCFLMFVLLTLYRFRAPDWYRQRKWFRFFLFLWFCLGFHWLTLAPTFTFSSAILFNSFQDLWEHLGNILLHAGILYFSVFTLARHLFERRYLTFICIFLLLPLIYVLASAIIDPMIVQKDISGTYIFKSLYLTILYFEVIGIAVGSAFHYATKYWSFKTAHLKNIPKLKQLRTQLKPHFFFNSLNNVYSLALQEGGHRTSTSLMDLSNIMHYVVYDTQKNEVPLIQEMEMLNNYVNMQRIRYEDKNVEINVHSTIENEDIKIEPLILLPLIENAFKHGVSRELPSFIRIRVEETKGKLHYSGTNSVHRTANRRWNSVGQKNLLKRLNMRYPGRYKLNTSNDNSIYTIELTLNLKQ